MQTFCSVIVDERAEAILAPYAALMTQAEGWQFRRMYGWGQKKLDVRKAAQAHFGLTKRQATSNEFALKQKVSAWEGGLDFCLIQLAARIDALTDRCANLARQRSQLWRPLKAAKTGKTGPTKNQKTSTAAKRQRLLTPAQRQAKCKAMDTTCHHLNRQIGRLRDQQVQLEQSRHHTPAICWGGRSGLRTAQRLRHEAKLALAAASHPDDPNDPQVNQARELTRQADQALKAWRRHRAAQFLLVGSKGEGAGNQTAQYYPASHSLILKLPPSQVAAVKERLGETAVDDHGRVTLEGMGFAPKQQAVIERALAHDRALTWLFFCDDQGRWHAHVTIEPEPVALTIGNPERDVTDATGRRPGRIGIDLNVDHLAIVVIDGYGNPIGRHTVPFPVHGTRSGNAQAMIAEAVKFLTDLAQQHQIGLAAEDLDFVKKKAALKVYGKAHARRLSGWGYAKFRDALTARAARLGIHVAWVNPAYTSIIGAYKYARGYAMSRHHAAALVIARRAQDRSERVVCMADTAPLDPVKAKAPSGSLRRNRAGHRWASWKNVRVLAGPATARSGERVPATRQPPGLSLPSRCEGGEHTTRLSPSPGAVGGARVSVQAKWDVLVTSDT